MSLTFDEATHEYRYAGERVPSVTQLIRDAGLIDSTWFTPESRERGTFIHKAVALDTRGDLYECDLTAEEMGYVEAARNWRKDFQIEPFAIEQRVYNETFHYAGCYDLFGHDPKKYPPILADYKTGAIEPWVRLQLAGYRACLDGHFRRMAIELRPNGDYRVHEFRDFAADDATWRAVATVNLWKRTNIANRTDRPA